MQHDAMHAPIGAKLVGGLWLPATEEHFVEMMRPTAKRYMVVDGKVAYQGHKWKAALELLPKDRRHVYVDIGAHAGLWAAFLAKEFEHTVAFEPVPLHADLFELNVDMAAVTLHRCALGAAPGMVSIETAADETGSAHVAARDDGDRRNGQGELLTYKSIPMCTLDSFGLREIDLIKIDVEGYERPVVEGARETLLRCKPMVVVEQKGNGERGYGHEHNAAYRLLVELGMKDLRVISGDHIMGW